ncbi:hypothetical protein HHS34_003290 [Acidithiobacillus montserratensis]|uniref:Uncharacterized protein n=1 Tax=Acidithiobacillus montserratensis TaxID=2729135 RepID=A0ACD5HHW4_9PROT|nr:hypothetical protein [Acidithiobacillus montserratensis]MBN2678668.1 hypothetical protein [Acidithiobacillaceae bacterium]MBU2748182.1 hypothetical protein [Acidithiobacillus montserratensis]
MIRNDFKEHSRITVTWKDKEGKLRPGNFYVYALLKDAMIVRATDKDGLLRKLPYTDVLRVVKFKDVAPQDRYMIPDEILKESNWKDTDVMMRYSSSPHRGK